MNEEHTADDELVIQRLDALAESMEKGFAKLGEGFERIEALLTRIDSRLEGVENMTVMLQADFESMLHKLREYFPEIDSNNFPF